MSLLGLVFLLVVWVVLFKGMHLVIMLLRHEPLIGWAVGPLGITVMFLHEPSLLFIWLDVLLPALVSVGALYAGLFTSLSPIALSHHPIFIALVLACGVLMSSSGDVMNALHDVRHPLWGEARVLRSIQILRGSRAKIHFTPFGSSYLHDHFGSNPTDLLQAF
jgi:hypothetical protein